MKRASKITSVTSRCQIKRRQSDNAKAGTTWIWLKEFLLLSKNLSTIQSASPLKPFRIWPGNQRDGLFEKGFTNMMYILERFPPSTFAGSADNWICLLSTRQTLSQRHRHPRTIHIFCGNSFQRRVKYFLNVKTLRVEEIRPDPVKIYFVGKEKAASLGNCFKSGHFGNLLKWTEKTLLLLFF